MNQLDEAVKYVLYKCRAKNNPITETLASFVVQTTLNKKKNKFFLEEKLNESELNELKQQALQKLSDLDTPAMKTIQLQIQYDSAYIDNELQRQDRIKNSSMETGRLIDDVVTLEIKNAKDFEGLTILYKKIFNFLLYKNRELIENANHVNDTSLQFIIDKEVAAALESVIPRAALGPFVSLNPSEKVTQLVELSNLVIGIRLFNKKIGKGGVSLSSIEDLTQHVGRDILENVRNDAVDTIELCDIYTTYFSYPQQFSQIDKNETERLKDELTFLRQYLSYILSLQDDIEQSENQVETNHTRFNKELDDLKHLLENKSSAPKEQVYPKFAILAQSHTQLFEEKKLSIQRNRLYEQLKELRSTFNITLSQQNIKLAKQIEQSQQVNVSEQMAGINYQAESGVQRLLPQNTPDFMQTPLDYLGFCLWSIVQRDGLLIPGKPALGVYKYKDRNTVFLSDKSVNSFLQEPNTYINGLIDQCRKNPQLIHLLRVEDSFKTLNLNIPVGKDGQQLSNKLMVDKQLETPVHFLDKKFDPSYCWNEWELRRRAIQMANIRKRQTKASQTILSNFKVDSEVQVYEKKEQSTSTGVNQGFNPLRPRNYITNLRDKNNK